MTIERASLGRRLAAEVLDAIFPQQCLVCGRFGAAIHPYCLDVLPAAEGARCTRCWRPDAGAWCEVCATGGPEAPAFDGLVTPFIFEGLARRALLEAKFRAVSANLAPLAVAAAARVPARWAVEAVLPVPLARGRQRRRGFNQSELLARTVARQLALPLRKDLLRKRRDTVAQAQLSAQQRQLNLEGAFEVRGTPPARVLVVDDITTTGATLSSIAAALKAAGAEYVYTLAVARED